MTYYYLQTLDVDENVVQLQVGENPDLMFATAEDQFPPDTYTYQWVDENGNPVDPPPLTPQVNPL